MPARIRIYGQEAVFTQGHWSCPDESLQAMLQAMADPRAMSEVQERAHALYAAGRLGGLVATELGWEAAPEPEPEIRLEDVMPQKEKRAGGLLGGLFRRRS